MSILLDIFGMPKQKANPCGNWPFVIDFFLVGAKGFEPLTPTVSG